MRVRCLTLEDFEAYAEFRLRMWPVHPAASGWENILFKYFRNPHVPLCPGSGLYAYFQGNNIVGIMGAYPMPITLDGCTYAGHALADWAVLPAHQIGPAAGYLWNAVLTLPGRKYAPIGSKTARKIFEKRAVKIRTGHSAIAILRPFETLLLRLLRLEGYAHPSPLLLEGAALPRGVQFRLAENFSTPWLDHPVGTAFVLRDRSFWSAFCSNRLFNGAISLSMSTNAGEANVVFRLLEVGRLRYVILMSLQLTPATVKNARMAGLLLRKTLLALGVSMIRLIDVDALTHALLHSLSFLTVRREYSWFGIRRPSDTFQIEDVRWRITNADEDSEWVGFQPFAHEL